MELIAADHENSAKEKQRQLEGDPTRPIKDGQGLCGYSSGNLFASFSAMITRTTQIAC